MVEELNLQQFDAASLNARLQGLAGSGRTAVLRQPRARHHLLLSVRGALDVVVEGSAGLYCCGYMNGPSVTVTGSVGWYAADNMLGGRLIVQGDAGSHLAPSMIGGTVVVYGAAGCRAGYGLKGGTLVVGGDAGMLAGERMLGGRIILLGRAGRGCGETMYGGRLYVRPGALAGMSCHAHARPLCPAEAEELAWLFGAYGLPADPADFECLLPSARPQAWTPAPLRRDPQGLPILP